MSTMWTYQLKDIAMKSNLLLFMKFSSKIFSQQNLRFQNFCVQKITTLEDVNSENFPSSLISAIKDVGLEKELRNDIYHWMKERNFQENGVSCWIEKEPMDYLRKSQMQWEKRIYKSLNSMCTELNVSLSVFRLASDRDEIMEKWNMLSTYNIDLSQYRPVYAPKDFLEVLLNVQNPNQESSAYSCEWDFSQISFKVKSFDELKEMYADLTENKPLLGACATSSQFFQTLENERIAMGNTVLEYNYSTAVQEYLKRLAPHSLRGKLWAKVLGSEILPWHKEYFKNLKQLVGQYEMMVDKLIFKDIQLTVCNDDQYFVFEDLLYQVMLCFSRDTFASNLFRCNGSNPIIGILKGKSNTISNAVIYPPNGVIPFHGFSMYAAPLCYIYNDAVQLYFTVRSFYMRFWFRLHEVNSHSQSMLSLCCLFQHLLEFHEPTLCAHFASINIQPIKVVFKWLMRCFSGHLPPEQLLYLWDIILGYDSLEVIPLLAVSILSFRKENLLQVDTLPNVEAILADLSSIHVIPLLQLVLLAE
ncbi:TBC1 domain family member 19 [Planococcus citri]|uniref:TBC1 domain family member 19 n=1 Tax=Planococcus citri TaxID=170843 RepID=UPI0031F9B7E7